MLLIPDRPMPGRLAKLSKYSDTCTWQGCGWDRLRVGQFHHLVLPQHCTFEYIFMIVLTSTPCMEGHYKENVLSLLLHSCLIYSYGCGWDIQVTPLDFQYWSHHYSKNKHSANKMFCYCIRLVHKHLFCLANNCQHWHIFEHCTWLRVGHKFPWFCLHPLDLESDGEE